MRDQLVAHKLALAFERNSMRKIGGILAVILISSHTASGATRYVTTTGNGNCTSWANACSMSTGLGGAADGDQVWVKAGTYGPIYLMNGVKLIGGFALDTETAASQSNPSANETIIDAGGTAVAVDSSGHAASTMMRGFTIKNGVEDSSDIGGGGLIVLDSSAMFVQCTFKNNKAGWWGAAVAIRGNSSPNFVNCIFKDNGTLTPTIHPYGGGAVFVYSGSPQFTNCLFLNNVAGEGGAVAVLNGTVTMVNCTMANNAAAIGEGGALFDIEGAAVLRNCIIWGNTAVRGGGGPISNAPERSTTITYSDVQGGWTGTGNINTDPLFVGSGNYKLISTSPCKNTGVDQSPALPIDVGDLDWDNNVTEVIPLDLGGGTRKAATHVEMGAYEWHVGDGNNGGGQN